MGLNEPRIAFFNYPALYQHQKRELLDVIENVLSRGAFILQKDLKEFEENLAQYLDVKHVFGVANGTDALILALRAVGVGPGDEVIVPSHTFIASPASVYFVGAKPVLAECGSDHMLDLESVEMLITPRTKAIMPVQLNGRTCKMDELQRIAQQHNLFIVEDAAQALGSKYKGRCAGTFGIAGTFSFYPAKVLGCFGDGGAVVTHDDLVAQKLHQLRDHGRNADGLVMSWGLNSRLDNLQAAVLNFKFRFHDEEIRRRRELASLYHGQLKDLSKIHLPPGPSDDVDHFDIYQNYEIEADQRDELRTYLHQHGISTAIQWGGRAVHQFEALGFDIQLPYTEAMFEKCLLLPLQTALTDEDVLQVCRVIRRFYGG